MTDQEKDTLDTLNKLLAVLCQGYGPVTVINTIVEAIGKNPRYPELKFPEWTPGRKK